MGAAAVEQRLCMRSAAALRIGFGWIDAKQRREALQKGQERQMQWRMHECVQQGRVLECTRRKVQRRERAGKQPSAA